MTRSARVCFFILFFAVLNLLTASVPPHPKVLERIRKGEIEVPYYLKNLAQIRSKGVNTPWSAVHHQLDKTSSLNEPRKNFGLA